MTATHKQWKSYDEQLAILQSRGLLIDDVEAAKRYLERVGYYRLSGYWYPFRTMTAGSGQAVKLPKRQDNFVAGSHFRDVVRLYVFDKRLRLLALDALERIEMAFRVDIAHLLGEYDIHAHENPNCLHGHFSKRILRKGRDQGKTSHQVWLEKYQHHIYRARREPFVSHYIDKYQRLPVWVAVEVWDFGMMSKIFAGMKQTDQNYLAAKYGLSDGDTLSEWIRSLNFIRNVSAHHSRLWNINVLERSPLPTGHDWQTLNNARPFFYFCLMQQLLRVICPNSNWAQRFGDLLDTFPTTDSNAVSLKDMGVVNDWKSWAIWQ